MSYDQHISLGDLEIDVMSALWAASTPLTVADVQAQLGADRELAYTTVLTVLGNLYKKGVVDRAKRGKAHVYWARRERDQAAAGVFQNLLQKFYRNSPSDMLAGFLKTSKSLTPRELRKMQEELARLEEEYNE